jgi:phosphoribosylformylglycinamidine synthase
MKVKHALILAGDGINCERETADAAADVGFTTQITHVNDLLASRGRELEETSLLILPGGFSFGDELGSGKILALKLKHGLKAALDAYLTKGGAVLGICNGFQVLTRLGVFGAGAALAQNEKGHFINRWVGLEITGDSIFTRGLQRKGVKRVELPMRHGEGRVVLSDEVSKKASTAVLRYEEDVNGAEDRIAGLASYGGRVMGLMPHPEAFWSDELHPWGAGRTPLGLEFFRSAYEELKAHE